MQREAENEVMRDEVALRPEDVDSLAVIKRVQAITEAIDGAVKVSLQRTNSADWKDMGGKYYLEASGCQKLRAVWGIYFRDKNVIREEYPDGHYGYYVTGVVGSQLLDRFYGKEITIEIDGGRTSKDGFFGKEPDPMDVRKAAISNMEARGIASFLGLKNFHADDLKKNGIDVSKIGKVEYKTGSQGGAVASDEDKLSQTKLYNLLVKICNSSDEKILSSTLQNLTKFKGKDGKDVPGVDSIKKLTGKRLSITLEKATTLAANKAESIDVDAEPGSEG